jgi:hypothetical protein
MVYLRLSKADIFLQFWTKLKYLITRYTENLFLANACFDFSLKFYSIEFILWINKIHN